MVIAHHDTATHRFHQLRYHYGSFYFYLRTQNDFVFVD